MLTLISSRYEISDFLAEGWRQRARWSEIQPCTPRRPLKTQSMSSNPKSSNKNSRVVHIYENKFTSTSRIQYFDGNRNEFPTFIAYALASICIIDALENKWDWRFTGNMFAHHHNLSYLYQILAHVQWGENSKPRWTFAQRACYCKWHQYRF